MMAAMVLAGARAASAANGSVLSVKETQIEIFLGLDDGIYPEQELYLVRGRKLLGKLKVTFVGEMTSWGEIMSLEAGLVPVPGDQVTTSAPSAKSATKSTANTNTKSNNTATPSVDTTKTSVTVTTPDSSLTSQQKDLLSKKEIGKKGKIYLLVENQNQAGITLGKKDGLKDGDEVIVFQGNDIAGKVKVKTLFDDFALCEISPSKGKTFKKGDVVIFNPSLKVEEEKSGDKKEEKKEEKTEEKKDDKKDDKKETSLPSTP